MSTKAPNRIKKLICRTAAKSMKGVSKVDERLKNGLFSVNIKPLCVGWNVSLTKPVWIQKSFPVSRNFWNWPMAKSGRPLKLQKLIITDTNYWITVCGEKIRERILLKKSSLDFDGKNPVDDFFNLAKSFFEKNFRRRILFKKNLCRKKFF